MWVDTMDCVPIADGEYWIQTIYGDVKTMEYTYKGGWNTHYVNGELFTKHAITKDYVARWHKVDYPPAVPQEWKESYLKSITKEER